MKCQKYGELSSAAYELQSVAVETHGPMDGVFFLTWAEYF